MRVADDRELTHRVRSHWVPFFRLELRSRKPIVKPLLMLTDRLRLPFIPKDDLELVEVVRAAADTTASNRFRRFVLGECVINVLSHRSWFVRSMGRTVGIGQVDNDAERGG